MTFVNTEFNHQRLLRSLGYDALNDLPPFHFDTMFDVYRSVQRHIRKVLKLGRDYFQIKCIFTFMTPEFDFRYPKY
ncbi:putative 7-deoxyloganetin glucosyltransferase [Helianthus anomalus]